MKRGCTQCGECLNVCPVFALFKREEYSPKAKRLLMEPLDAEYGGAEEGLPWERVRELARLCSGCERCLQACRRKLSTSDLLAEARARNPHWTQALWDIWIRRAGPVWPLVGRIAMFAPEALVPDGLHASLETARALVERPACAPWFQLKPKQKIEGTRAVIFAGCTARNVRPQWTSKAEGILRAWGYSLADGSGFSCCGGTLHHAGRYEARDAARARNLKVWRDLGKPVIVSFCASCKHSLDGYAEMLSVDEKTEWKAKNTGLSTLLADADVRTTKDAPSVIGYHQPCHWQTADPDLPLLQKTLPGLKKGKSLCCGMGGILQMSNPDLSARMGRACMEGFDSEAHHIITGCSGCVMQLSAAAPKGTEVRHWLDYAEV